MYSYNRTYLYTCTLRSNNYSTLSGTFFNDKTVLIEPISTFQFRMFAVARSFSKCTDGKTVCKILNYNPNALVLRKGIRVATKEQTQNIVSCVQYTEKTPTDSLDTVQQTDRHPTS